MNQAKRTASSLYIPHRSGTFWDQLGLGLSGLCAVHCLFLPLMLVLMPLAPALGTIHAWLHPLFAVLLLPVTVQALRGHRHGRIAGASLLLLAGLLFVLLAFPAHDLLGERAERLATLTGSAFLIAGHLLRVRHCRKAKAVASR